MSGTEPTAANGVWMSFTQDCNAVDVRPHLSEIDALRYCNEQSYGSVIFVPFGFSVDEAIAAAWVARGTGEPQ